MSRYDRPSHEVHMYFYFFLVLSGQSASIRWCPNCFALSLDIRLSLSISILSDLVSFKRRLSSTRLAFSSGVMANASTVLSAVASRIVILCCF